MAIDSERERSLPKKPAKFPLDFESFLRHIMRRKRPEDRMRLFRQYLRDSMRFHQYMTSDGRLVKPYEETPQPDENEVEQAIIGYRQRGIEEGFYGTLTGFFLRWLADHESKVRKARAKAGAAAKWQQKSK